MPKPGSHRYDIQRTRLRDEYDGTISSGKHAGHAANDRLERDNPAQPLGDPDRAAGPPGPRSTSRGSPGPDDSARAVSGQVELRSAAFTDHAMIPGRYSYEADNISPPLEWGGIPDGTQELVLMCEDPDAPVENFAHWVVTGISPDTTGVAENESPRTGRVGRNGFGDHGWAGPRPPIGDEPHRYFFRLYAVNTPLGLDENATAETVGSALGDRVIARGTLVGMFGR